MFRDYIMSQLVEQLKKNRPNLSDSSLKTYISILSNMYKRVFPQDKQMDLDKFDDESKFMELLKDMDGSKRKTYLSALVVLTNNDNYKKQMNEDGNEYNNSKKNQKKSAKEEQNWVSQDELKQIFSKAEAEAKQIYKLPKLTSSYIQKIQNYIILCLVSGLVLGSVRRSLDWTEMMIKDYNAEDNYLDKKKKGDWRFVFNKYKTAKYLGEQEQIIPKEFKTTLTKWIKLLQEYYPENDYLLVDTNGSKLNPTKLTQRLNGILGRKASVNIMRHSFITEKYEKLPALKQMIEDSEANGHSLLEELSYIKR